MNTEGSHPSESQDSPPEPARNGLLRDVEDYVKREPAKAAAAAFGAGLLLNFVPPRVIVGAMAAVAAPFMRPTLIALGLLKACELCAPDVARHSSREHD